MGEVVSLTTQFSAGGFAGISGASAPGLGERGYAGRARRPAAFPAEWMKKAVSAKRCWSHHQRRHLQRIFPAQAVLAGESTDISRSHGRGSSGAATGAWPGAFPAEREREIPVKSPGRSAFLAAPTEPSFQRERAAGIRAAPRAPSRSSPPAEPGHWTGSCRSHRRGERP